MTRRHRLLSLICLCVILFGLSYYILLFNQITKPSSVISTNSSFRGCIATLIRSDELVSLNKLLNMLNSLKLYFQNLDRYHIYLFHEHSLKNHTKEQILSCASDILIKFYEINLNSTIQSNRSGYAAMCQFWSYDLWFKYDVLQRECDYVMRFDDDSYLINYTGQDLFEEFHRRQLDYAYRIIYHDNNGLDFLQDNLRKFLPQNQTRRGCIETFCTALNGRHSYDGLAVYNNFFLIRLNLLYEHAIVRQYLEQLISIHAFHRYRIGDANIQTICLLLIEKPLKINFFRFPYNHNVHGSAERYPSYIYFENTALMWHHRMRIANATCKKVFIANKYNLMEKHL